MRLILQLCLLVLMLLSAEKRAWGKVTTSPQDAVRDWVQDSRLGGGIDAPPRQPTSGEAAAWDADSASAGYIHSDDTLTMAGPVVVTSRGTAFLMCPGAPPPFIASCRTTIPACVAYGPNVYAYVMQNPWTSFDPEGLEETKALYYPRGAKGLVKLEGNRESGEPLTRYNEHGKLEVQANHYESWSNKNLSWFNGPYGDPDKSAWEPASKYGVTEPQFVGGKILMAGFYVLRFSGVALKAANVERVGYHATHPDIAPLIQQNGFRAGTAPGRLGSGGTYVNSTSEGAIAGFAHHNPGVTPSVLKVQYNPGINASTSVAPRNYVERLPFHNVDSISAPSVRLPGTTNTNVLNGSVRIIE